MMLEAIGEAIWLAEGGDVSFLGFPYPTRMVVVRLRGSDLWVWSPIELRGDLAEAVSRLGRVAHLVSPNKLHYVFLPAWHDRFPGARLWGPASTIAKLGDLKFESPLDDTPPEAWAAEIDQAWFRGAAIVWQVLQFALGAGGVSGTFANPAIGWPLVVVALVTFFLLLATRKAPAAS